MKRWVSVIAGGVLLLWGDPATAYVQARDEASGEPVRWAARELVFTLSAEHGSSTLSSEAVTRALREAAMRWSAPAGCAGLSVRVVPPSPRADRARRDGVNAVLIHEHAWCRDGVRERLSCYDRDEEAVTTTYLERDAKGGVNIVEADIELNAVDYRWGGAASGSSSGEGVDALTNLFVHELGHVLGLAHDCDDGALPDLARDDAGHRPPQCSQRAAGFFSAMTPEAPPPGLTVTPTDDERHALCKLLSAPTAAPRPTGCACTAVHPGHGRPASWLLLLLAAWLPLRRRRHAAMPGSPR